ncbi:ABC transporter permease subunit [Paenibacillus aurantius]|uniref:ABC transporter permease subunit n=1 Tax=Paenibacillus aurantius TaxID=2918900 RepID=A0AA96RIM7_9BACL|nr:ABC transporter permease subunit [Paenibacillus aurantius]WJH37001.1 ABC transporter permease subunit [Paenibacillus sp. CC-CFT747]WNQ12359.1 ABC transporter permease subunit [Paenibacillus aurantius]
MPARRSVWKQYLEYKYFFLMLLPVLIYYAVFHYGPMYGVLIAFKNYKFMRGIWGSPWVGLENFRELFAGDYFLTVLRNTLIINFYKLLFGFPVPILLALMINEVTRSFFKKAVQTISYLPHFLSWIVLSGLIIEFLSPSRGAVNLFLDLIGLKPVYFITEPDWFRPILVLTEIWKQAGFTTIIYLAAIAGINPEMYEAADMDGISRLQKIGYITLPAMAPVIVIMLILNSGSIINDDFEQIYNLLNVKVMEVGDVLSTYTYTEGLSRMNYSYAAAVGLFKNVVALLLVLTANYLASKVSEETIF